MGDDSTNWDPRTYLREHHADVRVIETDLSGQLLGCVDHEARVIWLQHDMPAAQYRSTLAFEIAQLEQGPMPTDPCLAQARQKAAEDWAARRLIPTLRLSDVYEGAASIQESAALAGVDTQTMRARLRGMTDEEQDAVFDAIMRAARSLA